MKNTMSTLNDPKQTIMRLNPISYVVLGLIGLRGPSTAYELKRATNRSIAYFWPFPHAQLYTEPKRLAEAGLLSEEQEVGGRNRKTYHLTEAGRVALSDWLARQPDEFFEIRDTAMLQLFFGSFTTRDQIIALAESQIEAHRKRLEIYIESETSGSARFGYTRRMSTLRFGILLEKAYIEFWEEIATNPPES
jgi:DNA-binding PadR family transcriptional regulator